MVKPIEFYPIAFEVLIKIFKSKNEFESQKCGECRLTLTWSVYRLYCIVHISIIYLFQYISFSIYISVYISSVYIFQYISISDHTSCLSLQSQIDVSNKVSTPAAASTSDIGLCQIFESDEKVSELNNIQLYVN